MEFYIQDHNHSILFLIQGNKNIYVTVTKNRLIVLQMVNRAKKKKMKTLFYKLTVQVSKRS